MKSTMKLCDATTANGQPCQSAPMHGEDKCVAHIGKVRHQSTMTDEIIDRIVASLRAGNYLTIAVEASEVPRSTFYDWLSRGDPAGSEPRDKPFREMRERVERAKAEGETRNVAVIAKAAANSWQAAAWLLERGSPERWARPSQRGEDSERAPAPVLDVSDPFAAVDELARKRRQRDR